MIGILVLSTHRLTGKLYDHDFRVVKGISAVVQDSFSISIYKSVMIISEGKSENTDFYKIIIEVQDVERHEWSRHFVCITLQGATYLQ